MNWEIHLSGNGDYQRMSVFTRAIALRQGAQYHRRYPHAMVRVFDCARQTFIWQNGKMLAEPTKR